MRAVFLLLPLLMCGGSCSSQQTGRERRAATTSPAAATADISCMPDVTAELEELKRMVSQLRGALQLTQKDLQVTKAQLDQIAMDHVDQDTKLVGMTNRLIASEKKAEALEKQAEAQKADLLALKTRLAATEAETEGAKLKMEDLRKANVEQLKGLTLVKDRLSGIATEVGSLKTEMAETAAGPKVAFSAALTNAGFVNAGYAELNLVFSKVITNVGGAYSRDSGFFTAPVRGVYFFRFTVVDHLASRTMFIRLLKNGQAVILIGEYDNDAHATYLSSGVTLLLETGDRVNMAIPAGHRLYDDANNQCMFSGFLLFALKNE